MAATTSSTSSQPPPPNRQYDYDVFLSFRGEDTRLNFASHLFSAFDRKGFRCFRDDDKHLRGKSLSPALVQAIRSSRVAVVLLSQDYASSTWCLDELVKILECKQKLWQKVLPIFYEVDPSEPRKLIGKFGEAMAQHGQRFADNKEKVQSWRAAVQEVSNVSGWESKGRFESKLIQEIGDFISKELFEYRSDAEDLFGMDSRIQELGSLLRVGSNDDVRFVGIWGMGGIGKTTLAEVVYNKNSREFDGSCFLANVKEKNLVHLQEKLLSEILGERERIDTDSFGAYVISYRLRRRKTLIVLDDVDHSDQLEKLAGKHEWFGPGSRVIITTRDKDLLVAHGVNEIYKATQLEMQDARQLFCRKAFRVESPPPSDYVELVNALINYAKGLPLALKVLGSSLCGKSIVEWGSALNKLRSCPNKEIQNILRFSYDGLDEAQKNLFLDVAFFFNGDDKDDVIKFLEDQEFDFSLLVQRSLLSTNDKKVWMHDLLREMGREIVRQESPDKPGKRSRMWSKEDVIRVLTENSGTKKVRGIVLDLDGLAEGTDFSSQAFARMQNLRFLKIYSRRLVYSSGFLGNVSNIEVHKILHLAGGLESLSNELRCLLWHGFPLKTLPTKFHPENLVELNMSHSRIKKLWKGNMIFGLRFVNSSDTVALSQQSLPKLKILGLSYSKKLTKTPDLSGCPNLERLNLKGCAKLNEIRISGGILKSLNSLTLDGCKNLRCLPRAIQFESLRKIDLYGCSKLEKFPDIMGNMPRLQKLSLERTSVNELPPSIKNFSGLVVLNLDGCKKLESLPENIGMLRTLRYLYARGSSVTLVPPSIAQLKNLVELSFCGCRKKWPESRLRVLSPSEDQLPMSLDLSPISKLYSLEKLDLRACNLSAIPDDFGRLTSLRELKLGHNDFITIPSTLGQLPNLMRFYLESCQRLTELPMLLPSPAMLGLYVDNCTSLRRLQAVNSWEASFTNCFKLLENQGIDDLFETLILNSQVPIGRRRFIEVVIPGREIPKWFGQQSMGDSVSILLPPDWRDSVSGIVVCAVFKSGTGSRPGLGNRARRRTAGGCDFYSFGPVSQQDFKSTEDDHLWLAYMKPGDFIWNRDMFPVVEFKFLPDSKYVIEKCAAEFHRERCEGHTAKCKANPSVSTTKRQREADEDTRRKRRARRAHGWD